MALSRQGYKPISEWIPNELITEIIEAAPQEDQAILCRVSKLFLALGVPVLYRVVHLDGDDLVASFCSAILSNSALPELVRSFTVGFMRGWALFGPGESFLGVYFLSLVTLVPNSLSRLLVNSLKSFFFLEGCSINTTLLEETCLQELLRWSFPHLRWCSLSIDDRWSSMREDVGSFLLHHPGLNKVHIQQLCYLDVWPSAQAPIPLLQFQYLRCPVTLLPLLVATSLKEVSLDWIIDGLIDVEAAVLALKSMTRPDTPFVCSNTGCDNYFVRIMNAVLRDIPHTRTLRMRLFNLPTSSHDTEAEDHIRVQGLGNACPTLTACCLNRCAWRKVSGVWEKYPLNDFGYRLIFDYFLASPVYLSRSIERSMHQHDPRMSPDNMLGALEIPQKVPLVASASSSMDFLRLIPSHLFRAWEIWHTHSIEILDGCSLFPTGNIDFSSGWVGQSKQFGRELESARPFGSPTAGSSSSSTMMRLVLPDSQDLRYFRPTSHHLARRETRSETKLRPADIERDPGGITFQFAPRIWQDVSTLQGRWTDLACEGASGLFRKCRFCGSTGPLCRPASA
ncbi:hypothetical protein DFH09DRAFT_1087261 [Mycena vulgaris]|nr:hypothetical protein DFH09DRAFT_1087261 [Mycena vulgaris]